MSLLLYCAATLLIIGICLLGRNGKKWEVAVLKSMADPTLSSLILTFLLAGILSQILNQSGLVEGLIWLTGRLKISAGWMPLIVFLVGALIAASCGTTNGAIAAVIPNGFTDEEYDAYEKQLTDLRYDDYVAHYQRVYDHDWE